MYQKTIVTPVNLQGVGLPPPHGLLPLATLFAVVAGSSTGPKAVADTGPCQEVEDHKHIDQTIPVLHLATSLTEQSAQSETTNLSRGSRY